MNLTMSLSGLYLGNSNLAGYSLDRNYLIFYLSPDVLFKFLIKSPLFSYLFEFSTGECWRQQCSHSFPVFILRQRDGTFHKSNWTQKLEAKAKDILPYISFGGLNSCGQFVKWASVIQQIFSGCLLSSRPNSRDSIYIYTKCLASCKGGGDI